MTEQECQQVYHELAQMLRELQLDWVVDKVDLLVQTGKTMDVDLTDDHMAGTGSVSPHAVLTKPLTYTAQEQLLLLIDTIERIMIDTTEVEGALVDFLSEEGQRLNAPFTLAFASEDTLLPDQFMVECVTERRPVAAELRQLLQDLRQEALTGVN